MKEIESDKIFFSTIFYLKQIISKKMGAEVQILNSNFLKGLRHRALQCIVYQFRYQAGLFKVSDFVKHKCYDFVKRLMQKLISQTMYAIYWSFSIQATLKDYWHFKIADKTV